MPPFHDETVGIEQNNRREDPHHGAANAHHGLKICRAAHRSQRLRPRQKAQHVIHPYGAAGDEIGAVKPPVSRQVHQSQPRKEAILTHPAPLPE